VRFLSLLFHVSEGDMQIRARAISIVVGSNVTDERAPRTHRFSWRVITDNIPTRDIYRDYYDYDYLKKKYV